MQQPLRDYSTGQGPDSRQKLKLFYCDFCELFVKFIQLSNAHSNRIIAYGLRAVYRIRIWLYCELVHAYA